MNKMKKNRNKKNGNKMTKIAIKWKINRNKMTKKKK